MKFTYLLALALLLTTGCFNGVSARTQFNDLVDDTLITTFVFLDLADLITLVSTNSRMASLAKVAYRHKYGDYVFWITEYEKSNGTRIFDDERKLIEIDDRNVGVELLHTFGAYIPSLYISLIPNQVLEKIRMPLTGIKRFRSALKPNANNVLPFNYIFPNLRDLYVNFQLHNVNLSMIDYAMPSLEKLTILIGHRGSNDMDSIYGIIQKNPQIKSLVAYGFPPDHIKIVHAALPLLENLSLHKFTTDEETLQFDRVKHLVLEGRMSADCPIDVDYILCPCLESVDMIYTEGSFDKWKTFINNHQGLKKLTIQDFTLDHLLELTENLANLMEVKIFASLPGEVDAVEKFLQSHPTLMKAHFLIVKEVVNVDGMQFICETSQDEWDVEDFDKRDSFLTYILRREYVFNRKNPKPLE